MINHSQTKNRRLSGSMLKVLLIVCITFFSFDSFAQSINGIRIDTDGYPVTVYINGTRVSAPAASCFIANLRPDNYRIEVYEAQGHSSRRGRLLFRERVYYSGYGIKNINIDNHRYPDRNDGYYPNGNGYYPNNGGYYPGNGNGYYPNNGNLHRVAMSAEAFLRFLTMLENKPFDSDRRDILEQALRNSWFTSAQCRKIAGMHHFDKDKLNIMKLMYGRIIDREDFMELLEDLDFDSSRKDMLEYMRKIDRKRGHDDWDDDDDDDDDDNHRRYRFDD